MELGLGRIGVQAGIRVGKNEVGVEDKFREIRGEPGNEVRVGKCWDWN